MKHKKGSRLAARLRAEEFLEVLKERKSITLDAAIRLHTSDPAERCKYRCRVQRERNHLLERGLLFVQRCGRSETYFCADYAKEHNIPATVESSKSSGGKYRTSDDLHSEQIIEQVKRLDKLWRPSRAA